MKLFNHHHNTRKYRASALLLVIVGLTMIGGGLAAFFALSLQEDNDLSSVQLGKELDSIAMTGIELAAQAVNQGDLDFLESTGDVNSFVFEDEDIDDDSTADGDGFGTYTAQFDETDFTLNQISEYDLIIRVTRSSEISNLKGVGPRNRIVGDPRKIIITAEVRDAADNRKRLKAIYYKPWYNGNTDDITKPQAENWFFIRDGSGATVNDPMASYDSSRRGGAGEAADITGSNLSGYATKATASGDADEAENLQPLRIEKTAWLTDFESGVGEGGSTTEAGVFYRTTYDNAYHSDINYYFDAEINMPSKLARAADEVDLVDNTYENVGFKTSDSLGRFVIAPGTDCSDEWNINYMPHQGFFNNYVNTHVTDEAMVAALPTLQSAGASIAGGTYKLTSNYSANLTFTADTTIYVTGASDTSIQFLGNNRTVTITAGVRLTIVLLESLDYLDSLNGTFLLQDGQTENVLIIAEGSASTAASIYLGARRSWWSTTSFYVRKYNTNNQDFSGVIYAPHSNIYLENFAGLTIAKNLACSGVYLHNRAYNAADINAAHNANLGYNAIQVDHSDTDIYPADTTKYYLLSVEDDSGSTES